MAKEKKDYLENTMKIIDELEDVDEVEEIEEVEEIMTTAPLQEENGEFPGKKKRKKNSALVIYLLFMIGYAVLIGVLLYYKHLADNPVIPESVETVGIALNQEKQYTLEELEEEKRLAVEKALAELPPAEGFADREALDIIKDSLSQGTGLLDTLRPLYPDQLIIYTGGRYQFFPILENLRKNTVNMENVQVLPSGEKQYILEGEVVSHKGIDVSKHQGEIRWDKVKEDGIEFAIVRVGVRGYGTGKVVEDTQYEANLKGAITNGIKVGVYFFSQAITREEAIEEAEFLIEKIAPYKVDGPVVFDVEKVQAESARMNELSVEERTEIALAFLQRVEEAGYKPMLYFNTETGIALLDQSKLEKYDKWFAFYGQDIYYPYEFAIWQYSDKGKVSGIEGAVDLNIAFQLWE